MRSTLLAFTLAAGCLPGGQSRPGAVSSLTLKAPAILDHTLHCDVEKGEWEVAVIADSWTSGGKLHWTVDGTYTEKKTVPSVAAAEDGSWDQLEASFDVVDNWRKAAAKTTAFGCSEDVSSLLIIFDLDGVRSDCVGIGGDDALWTSLGLTPCEAQDTGEL